METTEKKLIARIDPTTHRALKRYAADTGEAMERIVERLIRSDPGVRKYLEEGSK